MRNSEEWYRTLYEDNPSMYFTLDERGTVLSVNSFGAQQLGYEPKELVGHTVLRVFQEEDRESVARNLDALLRGSQRTTGTWEARKTRKDGTTLWVREHLRVVPTSDGSLIVLVVCEDITELKALEARLRHQAFHDLLTGLPNRALFVDRLEHALDRLSRSEALLGVLFIDLDNFKLINDSLGHEAGDRLLVAVAERLKRCVRAGDTLARFGGDEFAVLLEDVADAKYAILTAERIIREMHLPFLLEDWGTLVDISIGIAVGSSSKHDRPHGLIRTADIAMFAAKKRSGSCYAVFDAQMQAQTLQRENLQREFGLALERGEFVLHYQPKVRLESGKIVGVEALVRWENPRRGLMVPSEFVPAAEETDLINRLGYWVLKEACRQGREWHQRYRAHTPFTVAVNVSGRQLLHPDFAEEVAEALQDTGLDPRSLELEITESVLMDEAESNVTLLRRLKDLSLQIAIDDFGKGYSSLAYLHHFPVDTLKMDRAFIDEITDESEGLIIVSAVLSLGQILGLNVVAEGVETDVQRAKLCEAGCDVGQGYYFSHPVPKVAVDALLAKGYLP